MRTLSVDIAVAGAGTSYWILTDENGYSHVVATSTDRSVVDVAKFSVRLAGSREVDRVMVPGYGIGSALAQLIYRSPGFHIPVYYVYTDGYRKVEIPQHVGAVENEDGKLGS